MYRQIPNAITVGRLVVTPPIFVLAFWATSSSALHLALVVAVVSLAVSDTIDGQLARRWKCTSKFGAKWDPIADKMAVLIFIPLAWLQSIHLIPVILIFLRDMLSSVLRIWINEAVPARVSGKIKTVVNLVSMCLLIAALPVKDNLVPLLPQFQQPLYWICGIVISVICVWSGWDYLRALWLKHRE